MGELDIKLTNDERSYILKKVNQELKEPHHPPHTLKGVTLLYALKIMLSLIGTRSI